MMKNNKGFTLVELLVASVITTIVFTIVTVMIVRVTKINNSVKQSQDENNEVRLIDKLINKEIKTANEFGYSVEISEENDSIIVNSETVITKTESTITINDSTINFDNISSISFTIDKNILIVEFSLENRNITKKYYCLKVVT